MIKDENKTAYTNKTHIYIFKRARACILKKSKNIEKKYLQIKWPSAAATQLPSKPFREHI